VDFSEIDSLSREKRKEKFKRAIDGGVRFRGLGRWIERIQAHISQSRRMSRKV